MKNNYHFSVTSRLILLALLPVILMEVIFATYHIKTSNNAAINSLNENAELIAEQLAQASTFSLIAGDYSAIEQLIKKSFNRQYIAFISIHNENNISIAQHSSPKFQSENSEQYLYFEKTIYNNQIYSPDMFELDDDDTLKKTVGLLKLYLYKTPTQEKMDRELQTTIFYSAIVFILSFLFIYAFTKRLTKPFYNLLKHIKNAEQGLLGETITSIEPNEIGFLQVGFNNMTQALLNSRNQLDKDIDHATTKLVDIVKQLETKNTELEATKDEAEKANNIKSSFLANMSHEIRTPINGIKGFIGLLDKSHLNDEQQRYTTIIKQSSSDLINIVNEILDFSKIESGKLSLEILPFDLVNCIESIRDQFFPAALEKNIDIYLSIYSDVERYVIGDQIRLKQILINLIGNAIKFTNQGHVLIKVLLSDNEPSCDFQHIQIEVSDSGIGINEDDQSELFNAFQQIDSDTNRRYEGTGLGLVISKKLAQLMNGDISLNSVFSIGSTFTLTLPILTDTNINGDLNEELNEDLFFLIAAQKESMSEVQSLFTRANLMTETMIISSDRELQSCLKTISLALQKIQYILIDHRQMNVTFIERLIFEFSQQCKIINLNYKQTIPYENCLFVSSTTHSSHLLATILGKKNTQANDVIIPVIHSKSKRILIVDDNIINLTFAFELLSQWGHKPTKTDSALKALDIYKKQDFDIVLMDIQMPHHDGIEGMKMLRKTSANTGIPIIALTANALAEEKSRLIQLGFNDYISKPIDENSLQNIIEGNDVIIKSQPTIRPIPKELISIDYEQTFILSGKNDTLINQVFEILLSEIPLYKDDFNLAKTNRDLALFKVTKHKLEGTTCYASLPKLKNILIRATQITELSNEAIDNIIDELDVLDALLKAR